MENHVYEIHTERLIIRCYELSEALEFASAVEESIENLLPWMDRAKKQPKDTNEKIATLRKFRGEFDLNKEYVYWIFDKDNKTLIWSTWLHNSNKEWGIEIWYWIHDDYCGKWYCTESTKALIKTWFEMLWVDYIDIRCDELNEKSANIPRKLWFTHESTIRVNSKNHAWERIKHQLRRIFRDEYFQKLDTTQIFRFDALWKEIQKPIESNGLLNKKIVTTKEIST